MQPWEMTREEWRKPFLESYKATSRGGPALADAKAHREMIRVFVRQRTESGVIRDQAIANILLNGEIGKGEFHKMAVATAIYEGRHVPPKVLADYPRLAKAAVPERREQSR